MEEQIQAIKDALREAIGLIVQSGQPITEDIKLLLVEVMEHTARRIEELRNEELAGGTTIPLPPPPHESSNINSFGYDEQNGRLLVKFQGDYPQQNGPVYAYGGVPKQVFDLFQKGAVPARTDGQNKWGKWWKGKVPSLGASMHTLIKGGGYPYERLQ